MVSDPTAASDSDDHISRQESSPSFFVKDRRKIHVGDCALFQADHAPPFIGIIRWFSTCIDNKPKLGVNWLYRPADIKLGKGILVDAAPNEVFYSFNQEELPASSLLHPCKVAFLRKDVELPSGLSSFVCRRVYDNDKKRLWWLTDQDYINGQQEEVDQLLDRTQLEMHALQTGGCSPKTLNGSVSSQPLKSGSDDGQTSGTSVTAPLQGKKRERCEQGVGPIKRERRSKLDAICSGKVDSLIEAEIAKIAPKGELASTEGVDGLVHLMQRDRSDRKLDLAGKVVVADLIAGIKRVDCLNRFVQLRGIPVLDDWLQGVHKGKIGDGNSSKEDEKLIEELLLALLRALDKLPVNLNALLACNIGKSVNHLRSHKNQEVQKKARSLVDTWKKRVDVEMEKINDATSVSSASWASRPGFPEVSCGANRRAGSAGTTIRNYTVQSSTSKAAVSSKPGNSDIDAKMPQVTPDNMKVSVLSSSIISSKESDKIRGCHHLKLEAKEEKISNSSQSQNNSQSCSSSHSKTITSLLKDDAKSSIAGSTNTSKMTSSSSRHRRSSNGFIAATSQTRIPAEASDGKPSARCKTMATDKASQSTSACGRTHDVPVTVHRNSHSLIVRIPNHGRSPIRSGSGGSSEGPSLAGVNASSSEVPDKCYKNDFKTKLRNDASRAADVNTESWQSNDVKERLVSSNEIERSQGSAFNEECCKSPDKAGKAIDSSKTACSSSANEKEIILVESSSRNSLSSKNLLIESCASATLVAEDDAGMNLLASVAAGEISRSSLATRGESPVNSFDADKHRPGDDSEKVGYSSNLIVVQSERQPNNNSSTINKESTRNLKEENLAGEISELQPISTTTFQNQVPFVKSEGPKEEVADMSLPFSTSGKNIQEFIEGREISQLSSRVKANGEKTNSFTNQVKGKSSDDKDGIVSVPDNSEESDASNGHNSASARKQEMVAKEESSSHSSDIDIKKENATDNEPIACSIIEKKVCSAAADAEGADGCPRFGAENVTHVEKTNRREVPNSPEMPSHLETSNKKKNNSASYLTADNQGMCTSSTGVEAVLEANDATQSNGDLKRHMNSLIPMFFTAEEKRGLTSSTKPDVSKLCFDLNKGFAGDDGNLGEPVTLAATTESPTSHFDVTFRMSNVLRAPITVAVPAKGFFVPPECLLKNNVEAGWKGSAATSAFRPAESKKGLEMQLDAPDFPAPYMTSRKRNRPVLDIDLNVPDDSALDNIASQNSTQTVGSESGAISNYNVLIRSSGGLDLDLNKVDERVENGQFLASGACYGEVPLIPLRVTTAESSTSRDFDLNGPGLDVVVSEPSLRGPHANSSSMSSLPSFAGIRLNNFDVGNTSAWFSPGSFYSKAITVPSFLPDGAEQHYSVISTTGAQRAYRPVSGSSTYRGNVYRSSAISSSDAVAFSHATAFPYAGYPFGSTFALASTAVDSLSRAGPCFANMPSQLVGPTGAVSSNFLRPCVISLPENSASVGLEGGHAFGRHGLDLNAGPGF